MNTLFAITKSWLCATGVIVVSTYCVMTGFKDTPKDQRRAAEVASRISSRGKIAEYKPKTSRSSAVKKSTSVSVVKKEVKKPTYVSNPIHRPFMNAWNSLTNEVAPLAKDKEDMPDCEFDLVKKDGNAVLKFPKEYGKVRIGGVAMGDVLKSGVFSVHRKRVDGTGRYKVEEMSLDKSKRLGEPEFYCTRVTYSTLPATRQVNSIRMRGDLCVGSTRNADAMVDEIVDWMEEDFDADDLRVGVPCGTLALKKLKIGDGMDVVVEVKWKGRQAADGTDAFINITFTVGELVEESRFERQELGQAVDEARIDTLEKTGVDYFTVHPMVDAEAVKRKTVCGGRCYTWVF